MRMYRTLLFSTVLTLGVVFGSLVSPALVLANSCRCDLVNGTSSVPGVCQPNVYADDCVNQQDDFSTCYNFRDNACQDRAGYVDPNSKFNPCWTEDQCTAAEGDFDKTGQDSPLCDTSASPPTARCFVKTPPIKLQIAIPGLGNVVEGGFPGYLAAFYKFFVALLAVASVVMIMWGGFKRIMAAGSPEKIKSANDGIISAITGLVLVLISYSLLSLINPKLINSTRLPIDKVKYQLFGDWCPDPDPVDLNKHYECGDKASVGGIICTGSSCPGNTGEGCYKMGKDSYQCLQANAACAQVNASNIEDIAGVSTSSWTWSFDAAYTQMNSVCKQYAKNGNDCVWVHNISFKDTCASYPDATKADRCAGKTSCNDFNNYSPWNNITTQVATGDNFAACAYNWCPGLNCRIQPINSSGIRALTLTDFITQEYGCVDK